MSEKISCENCKHSRVGEMDMLNQKCMVCFLQGKYVNFEEKNNISWMLDRFLRTE